VTADRRQRGVRRKRDAPEPALADEASVGEGIETRLARIEEALVSQCERTEELLRRVALVGERLRGPDRWAELRSSGLGDGLEAALKIRRGSSVPVDQPLVLISQAQRSGGTLLARLFDGHPDCHVHPHELHIGDRRPHVWPTLALDDAPETWFETLREPFLSTMFTRGRRAVPLKKQASKPDEVYYPFLLPPSFQRQLFLDEVERRSPITSERDVLNCYMTSLFNGWLDNQNLSGPDKRWVVAFSPRRAWGSGVEKLFDLYPEGRLISILREPLSWFASAQTRSPATDAAVHIDLWKRSVEEMLEASRGYPERVFIVRFEGLVLDTEATMRGLATWLDMGFDPQLAQPTFNRCPAGPNSSYDVIGTGIATDPVERYQQVLSTDRQEVVRSECEPTYEDALAFLAEAGG
jgi:hypothetical protein